MKTTTLFRLYALTTVAAVGSVAYAGVAATHAADLATQQSLLAAEVQDAQEADRAEANSVTPEQAAALEVLSASDEAANDFIAENDAATSEAVPLSPQDEADAIAASYGAYPTTTAGLYFRWADPSEFTCGYWDCAVVQLFPITAGCPNLAYVEANIVSNGVVVGTTNGTLGRLTVGQPGAVMLDNYTGYTGSFEINEISCY